MSDTWRLNLPHWPPKGIAQGPFQEVWYLKMNDAAAGRALWLRFTLLVSANGFRRLAETWGIYFERKDREVQKVALKHSHDLSAFVPADGGSQGFRIAESEFAPGRTRGTIQSKGRTIKWDLSFEPARDVVFDFVPDSLRKAGVIKNSAVTLFGDIRFTGTSEVNGEKQTWTKAPGMQGHLAGPRNGHSWVWGHCNTFVTEQGESSPFLFEGISARARMAGGIPTPRLTSLYFLYDGKEHVFSSAWDAIRNRSSNSLTEWSFQADRGDLSFRGRAEAQYRDFAGVTYEDTDGSFLYCANSKLSDLKVHVYRRGKLEATFLANGTAAFEVVSREKNPYVPLLI